MVQIRTQNISPQNPAAAKAAAISRSRRGRSSQTSSSSTSSALYLSHRTIIDNHADAVSVVLILICAGSVLPKTQPFFSQFLWPVNSNSSSVNGTVFSPDPHDICMVTFFTLCIIVAHAALKEYVIDKFIRKKFTNKLSNVKLEQLVRSTYMATFALISSIGYLGAIADMRHARILFKPNFNSNDVY